jgi:spore coat polysaccharide biosynthesis protein SpsF
VRIGIVLLARHASTRLPGKALAEIAGRPLLAHCLGRLVAAAVGPVVLATTERSEDDALVAVAAGLGVPAHRGSERDVLARTAEAAEAHGLDIVLRATGDNPAVDPTNPARVVRRLVAERADYVCERGLPLGAGVEAVSAAALVRCAHQADDARDREHVTTFITRHTDRFRVAWADAPDIIRWPELRLTVDTPYDLDYVRRLFEHTGSAEPSLLDLIRAARDLSVEVA